MKTFVKRTSFLIFCICTVGMLLPASTIALGRGNIFAIKMNGDCVWVKETQQNAGVTNNAAGEAAMMTMSATYIPRTLVARIFKH